MIINGPNGFEPAKAYATYLQKQDTAKADERCSANKLDRADILDISPEARQAQVYQAALKELPEVREDLVMSIKQRIQAGTYKPDPVQTADGILQDKSVLDLWR